MKCFVRNVKFVANFQLGENFLKPQFKPETSIASGINFKFKFLDWHNFFKTLKFATINWLKFQKIGAEQEI